MFFLLSTMNGEREELPAYSGCAQYGLLTDRTKLDLKISKAVM